MVLVFMIFVLAMMVLAIMVLVTSIVVIVAGVMVMVMVTATAANPTNPTRTRGGRRNCDVVGIQCHCTAERKNPARHTDAGSHGVTGERDQVSCEGSTRA